ncbi:helix-turn-helix domain-containing protein [Streptomyces sp. NPDC051976]|uniref:ArsR/SmtB family transcription factor n=1 Tax=Streptomyces sp. NPDC051976 TaxID=3154947 RepID=UPI0034144331
MLRIHFTPDDLQSVRIARQPDPLWELVCSVCRLQTRQGPLDFGGWRRTAQHRLRADRPAHAALPLLRTLIPAAGYIPDFLTPLPAGGELSAALDQVRGTPPRRLAAELARLAGGHAGARAAEAVPGRGGLRPLTTALAAYHRAAVAPHWTPIRAAVGHDVALRTRALMDGGTQALLHGLRPWAVWKAPVLEVDYPVDRDLHLGGRGLLLVPSYFCWRRPTSLADPDLPPVLVYPIAKDPLEAVRGPDAGGGLARLLGRTRAAVLDEVARADGRTTSELATAVNVSLPSASYQISVLRDSGLLATRRAGKYALHTVTPLGLRLLSTDTPGVTSATFEA